MGKKLKCKFCDTEIGLWRTTKKGKKRNGWGAMREHVVNHHRDEAIAMGLFEVQEPEPEPEGCPEPETYEEENDRMAWETIQYLSRGPFRY